MKETKKTSTPVWICPDSDVRLMTCSVQSSPVAIPKSVRKARVNEVKRTPLSCAPKILTASTAYLKYIRLRYVRYQGVVYRGNTMP